jgi:hypothetical protein
MFYGKRLLFMMSCHPLWGRCSEYDPYLRYAEMEKSGHLREHQARLDEVLRHEQQFAEEV